MNKVLKLLSYVAVAAIAAVTSIATVSYAAVPDSGGVIHGCYSNFNGSVRIIDTESGQSCNGFQTAISWNEVGPDGPQGPAGPEGPVGPPGPAGGVSNGRYLEMPWGSIPDGGTPVTLMTIPNFGRVDVTLCDADGDSNQVFTNTSGQTLVSFFDQEEIPPGGTVESPSGIQILLARGEGATSVVTQIGTNYWNRTDDEACAFHGIDV